MWFELSSLWGLCTHINETDLSIKISNISSNRFISVGKYLGKFGAGIE